MENSAGERAALDSGTLRGWHWPGTRNNSGSPSN